MQPADRPEGRVFVELFVLAPLLFETLDFLDSLCVRWRQVDLGAHQHCEVSPGEALRLECLLPYHEDFVFGVVATENLEK